MSRRVLLILTEAVVALVFSFSVVKAQSVQAIEDQAKFYLDRINKYPSVSKELAGGKEDSLAYYNNRLTIFLKVMLMRQPHTMEYGFGKLGWRMKITTSKDKKFRMYSWDEQRGGTMHMYGAVLQYVAADQVNSLVYHKDTIINGEWTGPSYYYTNVYHVTGLDTRTYYLVERRSTLSSTVHTLGIQCFTIENNDVTEVPMFDAGGEFTSTLDVEIDDAHVGDKKEAEIQFSADNRKMYLPQLIDSKATKRFLTYEFDGYHYIYQKVGK